MKGILIMLSLLISHLCSSQFLLVTEYGYDAFGTLSWFEVYNPSFEPVEISGWSAGLTDELGLLPDFFVEEESYLVLPPPTEIQADKDLLATADDLQFELRNESGGLIGYLPLVCVPDGYSFGQEESGRYHYPEPSPGGENAGGVNFSSASFELSHPSGFYSSPLHLELESSSGNEVTWYYSLGGEGIGPEQASWPEDGIILDADNANLTELSYIEASDEFLEPLGIQDRSHTLAIQAYRQGCPVTKPRRGSFFLDVEEGHYNHLKVVSLSLRDDDLFGDLGIYGYGQTGNNFAQRGRGWERDATISVFSGGGDLLLEQEVGLRIRGNSSRYSPQKSFKVFARNSYGTGWMENVFFPQSEAEELKRISLRSTHTDFVRSMLTDHLAMKTVEHLNIDAPDSQPVVLFLNGEFWGVYFLQEAMDDYYPESHYGVNDNDVYLMEHESQDVLPPWQELVDYARFNDLSQDAYYNWVQERVDIPSMIDYYIAEIVLANWDWPQKNVKSWFSEESPDLRFMFYDCDACWNDYDGAGLERFYPDINEADHSILFSSLMQRPEFRISFAVRLLDLFRDELSPARLMNLLESEREKIEPLVLPHIARWRYPPTPEAWLTSVESIQLFCVRRQAAILDMIDLLLEEEVIFYPNPVASGGVIRPKIEAPWDGDIPFVIFDSLGRKVQEGAGSSEGFQIDQLPAGNYLVRMQFGTFLRSQPIVVIPD